MPDRCGRWRPSIDPQSRLGEVRISVPFDPAIRPGGFAEAKISAGQTTVAGAPAKRGDERRRRQLCLCRQAKNKVERRGIKIGEVEAAGVTVAQGLSGREAVVLSAGPFLNPGQKVAPTAPGRHADPCDSRKTLEADMNFRNISSWCIRNPVPPIVLFVGLLLAGHRRLHADAREQLPGHRFPGRDHRRGRSPARRRARWKSRSPSGSKPRSAASMASRRSTAACAKASARPTSSSRSAPRPTARSTTSATPSPRSAATCPTASSSRRSTRIDFAGEPIIYAGARPPT